MKNGRSDKRIKSISRFISLILRHRPEAIYISLDEHEWADVDDLIDGINQNSNHKIDRELLEEIVRMDEKQRYSFDESQRLIRANQGHSIPVDVELEEKVPPDILWHGTDQKSVSSIEQDGLLPMGRLYVHLSSDTATAEKVGRRHGKPVIYQVDCRKMTEDGYPFYLSANKVWLTKTVPVKYLETMR